MNESETFERAFVQRTLSILQVYHGPYEMTLLQNCLLGLLVVPRETSLRYAIPHEPLSQFERWGIRPDSIHHWGKTRDGHDRPHTLYQFIRGLRNAVAHFGVSPLAQGDRVVGFHFKGDGGFEATLSSEEIRSFAKTLAEHLKNMEVVSAA